jgi:hypothetical protein
MKKKEMEILTEMIVSRLIVKQQEIDDAFFKKMKEHQDNVEFFDVSFEPEDKVSQREIYLEKIKDLEAELLVQEGKENYEIADTLKKTIEELKFRLNENI